MTAATSLLVAPSIAIIGIVVVYLYWYREQLKEEYPYLYYGLIGLVPTCGVVLLFTVPIQSLVAPLVALSIVLVFAVLYRYREPLMYYGSTGLGGAFVLLPILFIILAVFIILAGSPFSAAHLLLGALLMTITGFSMLYLYWYRESPETEHPYVYYVVIGLVGGVLLLSILFMTRVTTYAVAFWSLVALLMALLGLAVVYLYRYRKLLRKEYPYVIGLLGGIVSLSLLTFVVIFVVFLQPAGHSPPPAGVAVSQDTGIVQVTVIDTGRVDSAELVGPDGTKSTMMKKDEIFDPGNVIRLRSNKEVISYLNDPGNSITVLTTSGTKTVGNVSELPSEYQKAPDGFINPDADISGYDSASVATVSCLFRHDGVEIDGRQIPANVSIPCNTPVLAQNGSVDVGTSVKPTLGPNAGKTLTSPITLKRGEYQFVGTDDGEGRVIRSFVVDDETAQR